MRLKNLTVFTLVAVATLLSSLSIFAGTPMRVEPEVLDFGQVKQGEPVIAEFTVSNLGMSPQTVQFIDFSEPGLSAQVRPRIEAGSSVKVQVRWDTANLSGDVNGKITLMFNMQKGPKLILPIKGTVLPPETQQTE